MRRAPLQRCLSLERCLSKGGPFQVRLFFLSFLFLENRADQIAELPRREVLALDRRRKPALAIARVAMLAVVVGLTLPQTDELVVMRIETTLGDIMIGVDVAHAPVTSANS